jgi:hypothetical protein
MSSNSRRWRRRLRPARREVILSARVEYDQSGDQRGMSISEKGWEENAHIGQLREDVEHVIKDRLPDDLTRILGSRQRSESLLADSGVSRSSLGSSSPESA